MGKPGKRYKAASAPVDRETLYSVEDAVKLVKKGAKAKFDETIEIAMNLGVDPRHADQMVRGVCALPHGSGRKLRVGVFACKRRRRRIQSREGWPDPCRRRQGELQRGGSGQEHPGLCRRSDEGKAVRCQRHILEEDRSRFDHGPGREDRARKPYRRRGVSFLEVRD